MTIGTNTSSGLNTAIRFNVRVQEGLGYCARLPHLLSVGIRRLECSGIGAELIGSMKETKSAALFSNHDFLRGRLRESLAV